VDELAADFRDGVWLIGLAAVRDPALVAPTIAHALGVRESAGTSPFESLKGYLRDQRALLVLDSFERVAAAGPLVANLLSAAPGLVVLVTSRAVLRVRGEHEFSVEPLGVPSPSEGDPEHSAAVALFAERARASNPSFTITKENVAAVAEICRRLEGLPLAIELAAARVRLLPPAALLSRLSSRLRLLTGGAADLPERQRTMRGAIDWGHDLLSEDEQTLFRRLAVFAGGWALDAAEEVAGENLDLDVLDGMDALLGQSFVRNLGGEGIEPRFAMLETIREYALEQLQRSDEAPAVAALHAAYYLRLAEQAAPDLRNRDQMVWLTRLESEHANFRAALRWADEQSDVDTVLRLSAALGGFWRVHGHFTEGRQWLDRALSLSVGQRTALRATLLDRATVFARARGDYGPAEAQQTEAVRLQRELGDGDALASALNLLGALRYDQGDVAGARRLMEESLTVRQERGSDERAAAETMNNLGVLAHGAGELETSADYFARSLVIFRRVGDDEGIARLVMNQGNLYLDRGDHRRAAALMREAIARFHGLGSTWDLVDCLDFLATNLGLRGRTEQAGTLFGASEALREAIGAVRPDPEQDDYEAKVAATQAAGDAGVLAEAWAVGRTMTLEQAVAYALVDEEQGCAVRVLIFHGYLLRGTGSNIYNANLVRALVAGGHEVHLLCQDPAAEQLDFVDAVGSWSDGELVVRTLREPVRCTAYRPDIGELLPVYVADTYEGFTAKAFRDCSDGELATYVQANVAAVRDVVARVSPDAALANHAVMGPLILARALDDMVPYAVKIHGSAMEYTVRPQPERFLPALLEGLAHARGVLVGSR
ncbi:MAG: tetratricopeptide repeat protein, partial [Actinomycetota bacterium]|nr:tetratricopeptide repeat protein [Actinomycetota bacterium]